MKYQHVAKVVLEFYSYVTCVKGVWGRLNGTTIHQHLTLCQQKTPSPEKFQLYNF